MKRLLILLMGTPLWIKAQELGIRFETGLTWDQVKEKAKKEHKNIFVDCFATWCGPCKRMDKDVYTSSKVGDEYNDKFISLKLQIDKTNKDDEKVKSWYRYAGEMQSNYSINVFPTYLFFSPDGKALHKATGYLTEGLFIDLARQATDPQKQYYTLLESLQPDSMDTSEMKTAAQSYKRLGIELSEKIIMNYFSRIPSVEKFSSANMEFIIEFTRSPKLQLLAYDYLSSLKKEVFHDKRNIKFAVAFCNDNNLKVQDLCLNYLKNLSAKEMGDTLNLRFLASLNSLASFQSIAANYLERINYKQWKEISNIRLATAYSSNEKVKQMANFYIAKLSEKDLKEHFIIEFIDAFTRTSIDPGFSLLYRYDTKIGDIMHNPNYAISRTDFIIMKEDIKPIFDRAKIKKADMDWNILIKLLRTKYDELTVERNVLNAKVKWYLQNAKWETYLKFAIEQVNKFGYPSHPFGTDYGINDLAYDGIFMYSQDTIKINTAIKWMEGLLRKNPSNSFFIDTYANLLYKIGKVQDALMWEKKAIALFPSDKELQEAYEKMSKGEPTWLVPDERKDQKQ